MLNVIGTPVDRSTLILSHSLPLFYLCLYSSPFPSLPSVNMSSQVTLETVPTKPKPPVGDEKITEPVPSQADLGTHLIKTLLPPDVCLCNSWLTCSLFSILSKAGHHHHTHSLICGAHWDLSIQDATEVSGSFMSFE